MEDTRAHAAFAQLSKFDQILPKFFPVHQNKVRIADVNEW
jgi:hypothetical protein